jgi:hypothetical protein
VAFPEPKPGLVVRYDDLSTHEAAAGRDQGKDRPARLVAASDSQTRPRFVVLLPITHTPPDGDTIGIEIPATSDGAFPLQTDAATKRKAAAADRTAVSPSRQSSSRAICMRPTFTSIHSRSSRKIFVREGLKMLLLAPEFLGMLRSAPKQRFVDLPSQ